MDEQLADDTLMEERMELMVPPSGGKSTLRTAYFLKPARASIQENLSSTSLPSNLNIPVSKKNTLKVLFAGWKKWRSSQTGWKKWVDQLRPLYEDTWKKAGIFEAILASTYQTLRDNNLIMNLAEKWCLETNTFLFSWGEATITLEDVMVLGGYSVLGDFIISSPHRSKDILRMQQKLTAIHCTISQSRGQYARDCAWMQHFMGSGEKLEHEAFLALWLSRFVFSTFYDTVRKDVFHIAISLSKGIPIALAPAVLASIYRDMGLLKKSLMAFNKLGNCSKSGGNDIDESKVILSAPLHLVQLWAWERFLSLRPEPNPVEYGEPRIARWQKLKKLNVENVREALDSAGEDFQWRPYTMKVKNLNFVKFYKENQEFVLVDSCMDFEVESWIRCLRISDLVGIGCIEQYLPHRVAMQFGLDQDVPGFVKITNDPTPESAWSNYNRPLRDARLYIPARLFESDVTKRYSEWWDKLKAVEQENAPRNFVLPGFPSEFHEVQQVDDDDDDDEITLEELMSKRKWTHRNDEIGASGGPKIRLLSQILVSEDKVGAVKPTQSVTSSVRSEDENLGRVPEKSTMNIASPANGKDRLVSIDKNEEESYKYGNVVKQLEVKTKTADDGSVAAGVEKTTRALPKRLYKEDELKKLKARISYLDRIVSGLKTAKCGLRN
ncbi:hypothetical protein ACH5RR_027904 [Cinchona calisaya]|uniref:Aminotransferase-like plant mobile domain-containing protein n=1 Tax=Cinchona calisaya TaxID=153742 RepID=A0ABD2YSJ1_9GENT